MKKISIIVTVFNEERYIGGLLDSIYKIKYPGEHFEVIVVNDGSTDQTEMIVQRYPEVRLMTLPENMGRFIGRKKGAEAAGYPNLLFIDARSVVDADILSALDQIDARAVNGHSLGIDKPTAFETFYLAIRRLVFHRFYKNDHQPFYLTPENFDSMPKGTGVLFVEKELLFAVYQDLGETCIGKDSSDDTRMLRAIVDRTPILCHPAVKITNFARTSFRASVKHLYERGPKFVDYYFDPSKVKFWLVIVFPLLALLAVFLGPIFLPQSALMKAGILIAVDLIITCILARSARDFAIILFMLPVCTLIFYTGILRGIYLKSVQFFRR